MKIITRDLAIVYSTIDQWNRLIIGLCIPKKERFRIEKKNPKHLHEAHFGKQNEKKKSNIVL
jgi:5-keto 4-deoxyuronate isomerase